VTWQMRFNPLTVILGRPTTSKFKSLWKNYLWQSSVAALALFLALLFLSMREIVIIVSIGATAFIVFTMPGSITAQPRSVIGGHLIGLLSGSLFTFVPQSSMLPSIVTYSIAVGVSIFLMVATDTEHPPASGTSLGVAMTGFPPGVLIAVVASATLMSLAHHFLKRYMKKLTR